MKEEPPSEQRKDHATTLVKELSENGELSDAVAFELLKLLRDTVGWKETIDFIDRLPSALRARPLFAEQRALAQSKAGNHFDAIGGLKTLIQTAGPSPERHGLLGGRYKKLWRETRDRDARKAATYLNSAIEHYEAGRVLDLNAYYASSNLPLLLMKRNAKGDAEQATRIAINVVAACERAIALKVADEWVYPTLLVAAFCAGDVAKAQELEEKVRSAPEDWKLKSALEDIRDAVELLPAGQTKDQLLAIEKSLQPLAK